MARVRKTAKPKIPTYERIDRKSDPLEVYPILDDLIQRHRDDLKDATFALAWRHGFKRNRDGQLTLGKCKKVGDLDKQFQGHDFVIILNNEAWRVLTEEQRKALVFHELCHAAIAVDPNGNPKKDARNRQMYRVKKHDIEEFGDVVALFGCYKQDLENFVATATKAAQKKQPGLFDNPPDDKPAAAVAEPEPPAESHVERLGRHPKRKVPDKAKGKAGKVKEKAA